MRHLFPTATPGRRPAAKRPGSPGVVRRGTGRLVPAGGFPGLAVPVLVAVLLLFGLRTPPVAAAPASGALPPWQAMDYGPFLTASIEAPQPRTNIAFKGIAINLGRAFGGKRNEAVVFDTDLLRYSAGWTGDFVALKGVVFDGEHWAYPRIEGPQVFGNPMAPGWAAAGSFDDPRPLPHGPLPRAWAHWKGLYLHEQRVILSYSVGRTPILEMPSLEAEGGVTSFVRTLNLGPVEREQIVQLAFEAGATPERVSLQDPTAPATDADAARSLAVLSLPGGAGGAGGEDGEVIACGYLGDLPKAAWSTTVDGHVRLRVGVSPGSTRGKILLWRGPRTRLAEFARTVAAAVPPADLSLWTRGGPARWGQKLVTRGQPGPDDGPYAVDRLTAPDANPWRSWLRFGGIDFLPGGREAALCTWNGDVWVVSGMEGDLQQLTWQRVATGLFQPLGLRVVDGRILVLGRDQITRLHDLDGDGEADFYENFNNDCQVGEHFHEFATDLKVGSDGSLYYFKCARHALPASHAHHGTLMKVAPDGSRLEVVARGFRAVNGLGLGPRGELTGIDNQGHWMPANRLNWIEPGGWYGNQWAWNPDGRTNYNQPLCWMHNEVDRSGGTQLWVPDDRWGPFRDELITLSYGMGHLFLVLRDPVGDVMQGAVTRFPVDFDTGVMRGVFHPGNGQLYACGLFGWAGNKTQPGGFFRIRRTGKPLLLARSVHFAADGIRLGFTEPLDPDVAADPGSYRITAWNYRWSEKYGSPDFRLDGREGRDTWPVSSVRVAEDRRSVFLRVPGIQPVMQVNLEFQLRGADGTPVRNFVHGSIHRLAPAEDPGAADGPGPEAPSPSVVTLAREAPGLVQTFTGLDASTVDDTRVVRLPALYVPAGQAPSAYRGPGPFEAFWQGWLRSDFAGDVRFQAEGRGGVVLHVNGEEVLAAGGEDLAGAPVSGAVRLRPGLNRFELAYRAPPAGDAELRLLWSSARFKAEPIPPTVFVHDGGTAEVKAANLRREGLRLFLDHRCAACHRPDPAWAGEAVPDLAKEGPSLDGVGGRLREDWIARHAADPRGTWSDARMPAVLRGRPDQVASEARDLAAFLVSRKAVRAGSPPAAPARPAAAAETEAVGARLYRELGCFACHRVAGEPTLPEETRMSLDHVDAKYVAGALREFLARPHRDFPSSRMPDFKLTGAEADALDAFLRSKAQPVPAAPAAPAAAGRPDPGRGARLFASRGCVRCHRLEGVLDTVSFPSLARLAGGNGRRGCLAESAATGGRAPDFAFDPGAREALRAFVAGGMEGPLRRHVPAEDAARQYATLRCSGCHARDGDPGSWTALEALAAPGGVRPTVVDDEESAVMGGSVHVGRPDLTLAGEKLRGEWVTEFLGGTLPYKPRSEAQGRMPAYPERARRLAEGLAHQHGYPWATPAPGAADAGLAAVGARLTGIEGGFGCVSCHGIGSRKALAGADTATVNFAFVADRLRPSYYRRYVQDPVRVLPGTMMPKFIQDDGRTAVREVLDGDPDRQFTALWHYLLSLRDGASPP